LTSIEASMIESETGVIEVRFIGRVLRRRCTCYCAQEGKSRYNQTEHSLQMHGCKLCKERLHRRQKSVWELINCKGGFRIGRWEV
jgi:hypothetical protein